LSVSEDNVESPHSLVFPLLLALGCSEAPSPVSPPPPGARVPLTAHCATPFCATPLPSAGSSIAVGDIDRDGRPDLLLGQVGPRFEQPHPVVLLRNLGAGGFQDVTARAGLSGYAAWSAVFADLDNDGDDDLVLGGRRLSSPAGTPGVERVLVNDGAGHFTDRTEGRVPPAREGVPVSLDVADLDLDGRLDLVSGFGGVSPEGTYPSRVLIQQGDGSFAPLAPLPDDEGFAWVALARDIDRDGRVDLFVTHDPYALNELDPQGADASCAPDIAFRVRAGWINAAYTVTGDPGAPSLRREPIAPLYTSATLTPMGIAAIDVDRDGRDELFMTNIGADVLFRARREGGFEDVARAHGVTLAGPDERALPVSWSALARDLDRDGWSDLLVTRGVVLDSRDGGRNVIFRGRDATGFERAEAGTGFDLPGPWSALAAADFDGDGDDDLVLGAQTLFLRRCDVFPRRALYLRNDRVNDGRHALRVKLVGTVSSRDAIGARVEALLDGGVVLTREVSRGGATMASSDPTADLGLGAAARVLRLRVTWPSGYVQELADVAADQRVVVEEPRWLEVSTRAVAAGSAVAVTLRGVTAPVRWTLTGRGRWVGAPGGRFTGEGDVVVGATVGAMGLRGGVRVRFGG